MLNRCLDSIPTRDDVQIIVVDDNSDVDKKPILSRQNVELVLLDEERSKGAGRARNVGIWKAKGKWLLFADADDYYTEYLPVLMDKYADDDNTDMVFLNARKIDDKGMMRPLIIDRFINNYLHGNKKAEADLRFGVWTPWTRMVKRELVFNHHLSFEELPAGNDVKFGLNTSLCAKTIEVEKAIVYHYYQWPTLSITERIRQGLVDERLQVVCNIIAVYEKVGYRSNMSLCIVILTLIRNSKLSLGQGVQRYRKYVKKYRLSWWRDVVNCFSEVTQIYVNKVRRKIKSADC